MFVQEVQNLVDSSTKARSSAVTRGSCVGPGEPGEHKSRTRGSLAISSEGNGEISARSIPARTTAKGNIAALRPVLSMINRRTRLHFLTIISSSIFISMICSATQRHPRKCPWQHVRQVSLPADIAKTTL